jgi:hypothetical protein
MADDTQMDNTEVFDLGRSYQRAKYLTISGKKDPHGEAEGVVRQPSQLEKHNHASTVILCKDVADTLVKRFPDWLWAVQPQEFGGVINIYNHNLHTDYAYTLKMDDLTDPGARKRWVHRAGGEILRRFKQPDRMHPDKLAEAPRDLKGNCIPDISDIATKKQQQEAEIAMGLATGRMEIVTDEVGHQYLKVNW